MHEVSIISQLIEQLDSQLAEQQIERATRLHLRRGSTFSADALEQSFGALAKGTRLEGADLVIDTFETRFTCQNCGHSQGITSEDLVGHMMLCPACEQVQEIDEAHDLVLMEIA